MGGRTITSETVSIRAPLIEVVRTVTEEARARPARTPDPEETAALVRVLLDRIIEEKVIDARTAAYKSGYYGQNTAMVRFDDHVGSPRGVRKIIDGVKGALLAEGFNVKEIPVEPLLAREGRDPIYQTTLEIYW